MVKRQQNHNYQKLNLKEKKKKLSKQLEQDHRNGDHMEGYQWGGGEGRIQERYRE